MVFVRYPAYSTLYTWNSMSPVAARNKFLDASARPFFRDSYVLCKCVGLKVGGRLGGPLASVLPATAAMHSFMGTLQSLKRAL